MKNKLMRSFMQIGWQNIHETIQFVIKTCILLEVCSLKMYHKRSLRKVTHVLKEWRTGLKSLWFIVFCDTVCLVMVPLWNWAWHFDLLYYLIMTSKHLTYCFLWFDACRFSLRWGKSWPSRAGCWFHLGASSRVWILLSLYTKSFDKKRLVKIVLSQPELSFTDWLARIVVQGSGSGL